MIPEPVDNPKLSACLPTLRLIAIQNRLNLENARHLQLIIKIAKQSYLN